MKNKSTSRAHIRRQIRKANRIAAVDIEKPKRIRRRVILIVFAIAIFVAEGFSVHFAKEQYEYGESVKLAEDMVVQLSLIDSALRTGDRAVYDKSYADFHQTFSVFAANEHVKKHAADLSGKLANYHNNLLNNRELAEIINLRTATLKISNSANSVEMQSLDSKNVYQTKKDFEALRTSLELIETPELAELKEKTLAMTNDYINYLDSAAVCIGVCSPSAISNRQNQLQKLTDKYLKEFEELDKRYSQPYNPSLLIIELSKYSKM